MYILSFSKQLKERLCQKGISQKQFSIMTGISKSGISQYISGKNIPRHNVQLKIAKALDCSIDDLHKPVRNEKIFTHKETRMIVQKKAMQEYVSVLPYTMLVALESLVIALIAGIPIDETDLTLEEKEIISRAKTEAARKRLKTN